MSMPVDPVLADSGARDDSGSLPACKRPKSGKQVEKAIVGEAMRCVPPQTVIWFEFSFYICFHVNIYIYIYTHLSPLKGIS